MTIFNLLSAGVIAAAMLATPAMARENHTAKRHVAGETNVRTVPTARHFDGRAGNPAPRVARAGNPAPRVGALPAPPDGQNCDVGDNPFIC